MGGNIFFQSIRSFPRFVTTFLFFLGVYLLRDSLSTQIPVQRASEYSSEPLNHQGFIDQTDPFAAHSAAHGLQSSTVNHPKLAVPQNSTEACRNVPGAEKVMIVLKTGATEIYEKLPIHLTTILKCAKHHMIFSDLEQSFGDTHIYDALDGVTAGTRDTHKDFDLYRKMQQFQTEGQDAAFLKGRQGWSLDKWKFMPMMHKAYESAASEVDWFVYMEADTSMSWTNLLQWLATMDPSQSLYMGAQNIIQRTVFAHGGSGFVVSRKAAAQLELARDTVGHEEYDAAWEEATSMTCCGDQIVADAMLAAGVSITPAWPLLQGESLSTLDWTDSHWCSPAVTWHHASSMQVDQMWTFQKDWIGKHGWNKPYLYRDVFEYFIDRHVSVNRTSWNNLSVDKLLTKEDVNRHIHDHDVSKATGEDENSVDSEDGCMAACARRENCVQWMFRPGRCWLGKVLRFGHNEETAKLQRTSSWMQDRMQDFKNSMEGCDVNWRG